MRQPTFMRIFKDYVKDLEVEYEEVEVVEEER